MSDNALRELEGQERARAKRDWLDGSVGKLKHHLRMMELALQETGLRPTALDRPELRRRLKAVLEAIGDG